MSKSVISIIIEKYKKRKNFLLNGNNFMTRDGTVERDYIHVLDVVLIIKNILLFSEKSKKNFILNCGTEKNISIADIIGIAKRKINKFYLRILYCKKKNQIRLQLCQIINYYCNQILLKNLKILIKL